MSDYEFIIPENYDEAYKLKQEILEKINAYNTALFNGEELPYSDEEIDRLQEEYQILNDHLALSKEEKIMKLKESDKIINEDGTVEEKISVWDKIHWVVYLCGFFLTVLASGILTKPIGNAVMNSFMNNSFDKAYNANVSMGGFVKSEYNIEAFEFFAKFALSYLWFPILIILLSLVLYLVFRKKNDINSKVTKWLLIGHIGLTVISIALIMLLGEFKTWKEFYDSLEQQYYVYYYKMVYSVGY